LAKANRQSKPAPKRALNPSSTQIDPRRDGGPRFSIGRATTTSAAPGARTCQRWFDAPQRKMVFWNIGSDTTRTAAAEVDGQVLQMSPTPLASRFRITGFRGYTSSYTRLASGVTV
jgi:hypothetical protein